MSEPAARHVTVPRTARYYVRGDAASAGSMLVALHGYGQLGEHFVRHFGSYADRLVVVPEALSRFYLESRAEGHGQRVGASWMTRDDREHEIADYARYLDLVLDDAAPGVAAPLVVLGFSQGTATACRWLAARDARGAAPAARLILWAGDVPPDLDVTAPWLRHTRITFVVGNADPFVTPAVLAGLRDRLDAAGVPYEVEGFEGEHRIVPEVLARVLDT